MSVLSCFTTGGLLNLLNTVQIQAIQTQTDKKEGKSKTIHTKNRRPRSPVLFISPKMVQ